MNWLAWVCGIGGAVICIVALLIIRIELIYRRKGEDDAISITISTLAGLVRIRRQIPLLKLNVHNPSVEVTETTKKRERKKRMTVRKLQQFQHRMHDWKTQIVGLFPIIKAFLAKARCEQLMWHSTVGTGDAAETGTLTGLVWAIKTTTVGWGTRYLKMKTVPDLHVIPDFHHSRLETHFHCIVKFRIGEAILTGIRILLHTKKRALSPTKHRDTVYMKE